MEKEDPLERLDRLEREKNERKANRNASGPRTTMYILIAVAAVLAITLAVVWIQKSSLVNDLKLEKEDLTEQIQALQTDYENLSSDYESINSQLDSSREEISQLVERIKKTDATNRAKMRQYEKELGTLRSIMRGYIVQIDSLNNLNHQLTVQAAQARREADESKRQNEKLTAQVDDLANQVAVGSVIKARGIKMESYNASDRLTDRSSRVVRLLVHLSLLENDLAPKGPVRVFVIVRDPSGNVLLDGSEATFILDGETVAATASREVDYEGNDMDLSIYVNNIPSFVKGVYTVEAFTAQSRLGSAELLLR